MSAGLYLHNPSSLEHNTGDHPENAQRIVAIENELERNDWLNLEVEVAPAVELERLHAIHPAAYVESIGAAAAAAGHAQLDPDTVVSSGSWQAALDAAGGATRMVDALLDGEFGYGFCGLRPPGHHAESAKAMGFCLFNNVAVAAQHALEVHGLDRVLIFDWDVHHGNGTNDIFFSRSDVLYVSIHQSPLYPGSGGYHEFGEGPGEGYTINLPVPPESGQAQYFSLINNLLAPIAFEFEPQMVLVSAGYDAHRDDPLANIELDTEDFGTMTSQIAGLAKTLEAPLGFTLEGGYNLDALAASVAATLTALKGERLAWVGGGEPDELTDSYASHFARWWPALAN